MRVLDDTEDICQIIDSWENAKDQLGMGRTLTFKDPVKVCITTE